MARPGYKIKQHLFKSEYLDMMDSFGVYKVFHTSCPSKIYIGSTISRKRKLGWRGGFYTRWSTHLSLLKACRHTSKDLQNVVNKHGINGIRFVIIEITNADKAREREGYYIETFKPFYNSLTREVYQFDRDGKFLQKHKSVKIAGENTMVDYTSISSACAKRRPSAGGYLWSFTDKPIIPSKRVIQKFSLDGEYLDEYNSLESIKKELGIISSTSIRNAIKGEQNKAYGFKWKEV